VYKLQLERLRQTTFTDEQDWRFQAHQLSNDRIRFHNIKDPDSIAAKKD
jgi:hypothetical protein